MEERTLRVISLGVRHTSHIVENDTHALNLPGVFAGSVGIPRLLKLFDKYNIKTTFFIPGHSLEPFPEECAMVRDAGHEMCD